MDAVRLAFYDYFKSEHRRSEACLSTIVGVLSENSSAQDSVDLILEVLIVHYKREDK